jgi:inorganic pyrophosphatase
LEGKRVEIKGWHDAAYARDQVLKATKQFEDSKAKALDSNPVAAGKV